MPTLDELGHRIAQPFQLTPSFGLLPSAASAALKAGRMPGGSLEAWLSHLATPAPFLDQSEKLHNAAIAQELITLIVDEIERSEAQTLAAPMPYWLGRLVTLWDRLGATVITFNYDTLVEMGVNATKMPWIIRMYPDPNPVQGEAVPLRKMHGSTNWWWIPSDRVGTTVRPEPLAGQWGKPEPSQPNPGMEHFKVPPLATKSDYYDLSVTREDWLTARESLQAASRVVLMGYSAPLTDLTVAALLGNYADPGVPCVVVDTHPDDIVRRLRDLGISKATPFDGGEPIRLFVEHYEEATSRNVAASLLALVGSIPMSPDDPVVARVSGSELEPRLPIIDIRRADESVTFVAKQWQPGEVVADLAVKAREVREAIEEAVDSGQRLILDIPGQPQRAVLHVAGRTMGRNWLVVEA